jgi:hypothetical protein
MKRLALYSSVVLCIFWAIVLVTIQPVFGEDGYSAVVLLDSNGVSGVGKLGVGHVAILLCSKDDGILYFSKSNTTENSKNEHYNNLDDFKSRITRYDEAFKMAISKSEFEKMKNNATSILGGYYHLTINNCADFIYWVLRVSSLYPGNREIIMPNKFYSDLVRGNNGVELW